MGAGAGGHPDGGGASGTGGAAASAGTAGAAGDGASGRAGAGAGGAAGAVDAGAGCGLLTKCGGACIDTDSDGAHCGACGRACASGGAQSVSCVLGVCAPSCVAPFANCASPPAPATDDGCETDTSSSLNDCGVCGTSCTNANGSTSCAGGACQPVCTGPFRSCDADATNGCEANTATDVGHCGSCGTACTNSNGTTSCVAGSCVPSCSAGFASCNSNLNDGCEVDLRTSASHCGRCGHGCQGGSCSSGFCRPVVVASDTAAYSLEVDATHVYWHSDRIYRVAKSGGMPAPIFSAGIPSAILVRDKLYFHADVSGTRGVWNANLDGTTAFSLHTLSPQGVLPSFGLGWFAGELFFANNANQQISAILGFPSPRALTAAASAGNVWAVCVNQSSAYWASNAGVLRVDRGAASATPQPLDVRPARDVACDDANVYYTVAGDVVRQPAAGGSQTVLATVAGFTSVLQPTSAGVYFAAGSVVYLQPSGATGAPLVVHDYVGADVQAFAEDTLFVYFVSNHALMPLMKVAK